MCRTGKKEEREEMEEERRGERRVNGEGEE